jgi:hypothetical protein
MSRPSFRGEVGSIDDSHKGCLGGLYMISDKSLMEDSRCVVLICSGKLYYSRYSSDYKDYC